MNKYTFILILTIFVVLLSCENKPVKNESIDDLSTSDKNSKPEDSTTIKFVDQSLDSIPTTESTQVFLKGKNLKTADFIIQYPANQNAELKSQIEHLRKEWQNVRNPITATYIGNDFGDYHHVIFKDANGVEYDYGQANNNYGSYKLHENSGQYEDHPDYLGKEFKVYWDWTLSEFLCCDGEYGKAKAYLPAITKLELIKK